MVVLLAMHGFQPSLLGNERYLNTFIVQIVQYDLHLSLYPIRQCFFIYSERRVMIGLSFAHAQDHEIDRGYLFVVRKIFTGWHELRIKHLFFP